MVTWTQIGYAIGVFLLMPLGDAVDRRRVVPRIMLGATLALAATAAAPSCIVLPGVIALAGATSVAGKTLTPMAGDLATDDQRGRVLGTVASGLVSRANDVAGTLRREQVLLNFGRVSIFPPGEVDTMASIKRLPKPLLSSYEWQTAGACRTTDPDEFFPADSERGNRRLTREQRAKALCATCPVIRACFEHAMAVQEPYGVWGGTSPEEREQFRQSVAS